MLKLSRECFVGGRDPTSAELDRLAQYGVIDVDVMRQADGRIPELDPEDAAVAEMDAAMNARGMPVDVESTRKLINVVRDREDARLTEEIAAITGGEITTPNQNARILAFLSKQGVRLPNVQKETLKAWIADNPGRDDVAAQVIRIRREAASSAGKKLDAILQAATGTGVVRNTFLHHGAHTGRWAGRGAQLQNLPKNKLVHAEATLAWLTAETPLHADSPDAKLSIKAQIAGCIRALFLAPEGRRFVAADLSQIESRVLCYLAGQEDKLALYRAGKDIYLPTAQALGSDDRDLGKLVVLSCGFGATYRVLLKRAPLFGVTLTAAEAIGYVAAWQRDNPQIVKFWNDLHGAFRYVVEQPLGINRIAVGALILWRDAEAARIQLPSGRELVYRNPRLEPRGEFGTEVVADLPEDGVLKPVWLWFGHLAENVTQAVACDVLIEAMLTLHREGAQLVGTIHDEIVTVVPAADSKRTLQCMLEVMRSTPAWAPGLPLWAEGFINRRFLKPKEGSVPPTPPPDSGTPVCEDNEGESMSDAEVLQSPPDLLPFHPLADIFPLMEGAEYAALVEDIRTNGQVEAVVVLDGMILDGRNRARARRDLGLPVNTVEFPGGDPRAFVRSENLHRRHLNESQRAMHAADLANMDEGRPSNTASIEAVSQERAAEICAVSRSNTQRAVIVRDRAIPEIATAVREGNLPVSLAARVATLSVPTQQRVAAEMRSDTGKSLATIVLAATRREQGGGTNGRAAQHVPLSELGRTFPVLLGDPAWHQTAWSEGGMLKAAEMHYPTMSVAELCALKVADIAARDAVLFMWALANMLPEALQVLAAWGFTFCTSAVWVKPNLACGHWFRGHHEPLIVATRGNMPPPPELHSSVFEGARSGPHSGKPDVVRNWIAEAYPDAGKIELFARTAAPGWTAWGNQAPVE